ncbi:MAG: hypothetical protein CME35_00880 [Gramella sp.]|jgi:hypothetical protein|nr:hypothetical protein [Christiangramia sp.]|tara:strand:- start:1053 stop:1253 length:201 start_codon:yes stop_codon:yes gene_type:complete
MNKREVIERIKKEIGPDCDDKMAEFIFKKALEDKQIIVKFDWEVIMNRVITIAVIIAAIWALIQYV